MSDQARHDSSLDDSSFDDSSLDGRSSGGSALDVTRRVLVKLGLGLVGAGYAGAIGYPVYRYLATPAQRAAAAGAVSEVALPKADLPGPGTALFFRFGNKPALLIHHKDDSMVFFSAVCTHLACTVRFEPENDRIFCACHGGQYDMHTGEVLGGPPPAPLTRFHVEANDVDIVISRT